ncbi:MAG TPA: DUF2794 domain-containing protein [Alphaproteobacteria bacterium]|nr:DUF2794 domain-containing protein [Alphaproteobacteria bacterium]HAJ47740.1 DUF2794 domain-containing protein [Alphaproteobacteria bacterium]
MVDEPISLFRVAGRPATRSDDNSLPLDAAAAEVFFDRRELQLILNVYGRMVANGEWRDYGLLTAKDYCAFAVYRRTAEFPLYRIEKRPKLRNRQGMYSVVSVTGLILKRGHELQTVLRVFED